ncbi:hypothetical protein [Polyangium fumosum]|uniref:hypothetical protein n=1 Tax=Polyangium fumosum TaxID=889272 RepID=UPI001E4682A5|nr:hypothetical protein [Polyangium fumosum]
MSTAKLAKKGKKAAPQRKESPPSPEQAEPTAELQAVNAAALVARYVELNDVRLVRISAEMRSSIRNLLSSEYATVVGSPTHSFVFDEAQSLIRVTVGLTVSLEREPTASPTAETRESGNALVNIAAEFYLEYYLKVEPPPIEMRDKLFGSFAAVNAVYNAWPYLREVVQDTSGRLGVPPIVLPVYRVPRPGLATASSDN